MSIIINPRHKLTNKDTEGKQADCSICGPNAPIRKKLATWRCRNAANATAHQTVRRVKARAARKPAACEICDQTTGLVWDHNHETGGFRGWLCHPCNSGLGLFGDSPDLLEKAVKYLEARGNYAAYALARRTST